ncbi:hypothetical protein KFK09_013961 [Dendrobium nobile]|uniref:Deoxynucleoside kinase domain-containing protein n=1 Tax=Dendrobium nobile TaxID=94219 RepID=A0A8T3B8M8_DENNO|nr:hypothetical protein KFK09_013961 [Dendrobium nobile]
MQKLLRESSRLSFSIPHPELPMTAALHLRHPSASTAGYARPSRKCLASAFLQLPLLPRRWQQSPPPARMVPAAQAGSAGRGFRNPEGLRGRENKGSTEDAEEDLKCTEKISEEANERSSRAVQPQRRQRSGSSGDTLVASVDLLSIPGVGPRNLRKLVDKGFRGVDELKQFYKDKYYGKASQKMVEFLQSSVGIIHKNHAESITSFIKESVDEELKQEDLNTDLKPSQKKRLTFCVEGNISVGKTTFLQRIANETIELRDLVEIVPEPISKWQDIGPDHFNILDAFYSEPKRYAYTFQNYVFVTRVMQERESSGGIKPLRLMERSVFSDRMVYFLN